MTKYVILKEIEIDEETPKQEDNYKVEAIKSITQNPWLPIKSKLGRIESIISKRTIRERVEDGLCRNCKKLI